MNYSIISLHYFKMQQSIIIAPLPRINIQYVDSKMTFSKLFGKDAHKVLSYQAQTIGEEPNLNAFRYYINEINALSSLNTQTYGQSHHQLQTKFTNPFNGNSQLSSISVDVELLNSIWNFASGLSNYLLGLDPTSYDSLKNMRVVITDLLSCAQAFTQLCDVAQHPFLTSEFGSFFQEYINYVVDYWQLCYVITQKESLVPKPAMRCIEDISKANTFARKLHKDLRHYFTPVCELILRYLNLLVRYYLGKNADANLEIGLSYSYFMNGYELSKKPIKSVGSAPHLSLACKIIQNNLITGVNTSKKKNKSIYMQNIPEMPELPEPSKAYTIPAGESLLKSSNNCPHEHISHSAHGQPSSAPTHPPTGPPVFTPNDPPVFTPKEISIPPQFNPEQNSSPSSQSHFPNWDRICHLKKVLGPRIENIAKRSPHDAEFAKVLQEQMKVANESDKVIENAVNSYVGGPKEQIEEMIAQASTFYNAVHQRVSQIETA